MNWNIWDWNRHLLTFPKCFILFRAVMDSWSTGNEASLQLSTKGNLEYSSIFGEVWGTQRTHLKPWTENNWAQDQSIYPGAVWHQCSLLHNWSKQDILGLCNIFQKRPVWMQISFQPRSNTLWHFVSQEKLIKQVESAGVERKPAPTSSFSL